MNVNDYLDLVPYRNSLKEKYMAFVRLILTHTLGLAAATESTLYAFDLSNAVGVNLDTIGELVGMPRLLPYKPTIGSRLLSDSEYRMMIRLKIARNVWDGRNETVQPIYNEVFPQFLVEYTDNYDMTVTLVIRGGIEGYSREKELLELSGALLVPAGVRCNINNVVEDTEYKLYIGTAVTGEKSVQFANVGYGSTWGELKESYWEEVKERTWFDLVND